MSNLYINIRFGARHFQLSKEWKIYWTYNPIHAPHRREKDFKWFAVYEFPGINMDPGC